MRSRLVALILLPTAVAVLVTGIQLAVSIATSVQYSRLAEVARLVEQLGTFSHEVAKERDLTSWYLAERRRPARLRQVEAQQDAVDKIKGQVTELLVGLDDSQGQRVRAKVWEIERWLNGLPGLRKLVAEGKIPPNKAFETYTELLDSLRSLHRELGRDSGDDRLFGDSSALEALTTAKEQLSIQRGLLTVALVEGKFDYDYLTDFLAAYHRQDAEVEVFLSEAAEAYINLYVSTVRGEKVDQTEWMRSLALKRVQENVPLGQLDSTVRNNAALWFESSSDVIERMRTVERQLSADVVRQSLALQASEQQQALVSGIGILVLLLLVLFVTSRVATSLVRPLRRLRSEALEIAGHRLPETVQRLREAGDNAATPEIVPISVASRDEIGEVARAFDEVHREAVRLAGDEARLRSNVNAIFVNLSRRSQTLVERQLALIESLEQGEQDEARLADLFKLDHLATRMRRNSENLLVLAGQEPARRWSQPVPVVDVVRAALSEVENYDRVTLRVQSGGAVIGQAVNDVVHLLAELVENAISFSPRETRVVVSSNRIDGGGLMISVSDQGIGMTPEELAQANHRLAEPPVVDVSVSRRMGLFVVGRLALRHGIRVQLRQQDTGGLTAMVLLPETLLAHTGPQIPGVPASAEQTGPMPLFGHDKSGAFGTPVMASPTTFDSPPAASGAPAFGADMPEPASARGERDPFGGGFGGGPFDSGAQRSPFESGAQRSPFDSGPQRSPFESGGQSPFESGAQRSPFESGPQRSPFEAGPQRSPFDSGAQRSPFDSGPQRSPFEAGPQRSPFESGAQRSPFERTPVDTSWPGHLPPPGGGTWQSSQSDDTDVWSPAAPAGSTTGGSLFGPPPDMDNTGPLPQVRTSPMEAKEEEYLPIFAAVESDWFKRVEPPARSASADDEPQGTQHAPDTETDSERTGPHPAVRSWSSPSDAAWQTAAQVTSSPTMGGLTAAGLPKRVPKANLVPGSADPGNSPAATARPILSPDRVRSRLSSFQQGIRQGRAVARGEISEDEGYPGARRSFDSKEDT